MTPAECENYRISCQEAAFVDDLCVRNVTTGHKVNYQAKNSDGSAANWDADMQNRFDMQAVIDEHHHKAATWEQVLVVSSEAKAAANDAKSLMGCVRTAALSIFRMSTAPPRL